jgi:hypothetical protein
VESAVPLLSLADLAGVDPYLDADCAPELSLCDHEMLFVYAMIFVAFVNIGW